MIMKLLRILGLAALAGPGFAQSVLSSTTFSGALTSSTTVACLASATNVVVPSLAGGYLGSFLVAGREVMQVNGAGPSTTCFQVDRGIMATSGSNGAVAHPSGEKVWVLGQSVSTGDPSRPISSTTFLSQRPYGPFQVVITPPLGGVAPTTVTDVNGKFWYAAAQVDFNWIATGACILNGSTDTTDAWILALYDRVGNLVANTAVAGVTVAGTSIYQCIPFATPVAVFGPEIYYLAMQGNGTHATFQAYITGGAFTGYPAAAITGGTFGTLPNPIKPATTFTTAVGPVMTLY